MYETLLFERDGGVATIALNRICGYDGDHKEGIAAFFEKRAPTFTGN